MKPNVTVVVTPILTGSASEPRGRKRGRAYVV